jgi:hypothetical protein
MTATAEKKTEKRPDHIWDVSEILEGQVKFLMEEEKMSEEDARENAYSDQDLVSLEWDDLLCNLNVDLDNLCPHGYWYAEVHNFGWQSKSGWSKFHAKDAKEFLDKILPRTECTFHIYIDKRKRTIRIQNWHHDSPWGNEWYAVRPMRKKERDSM